MQEGGIFTILKGLHKQQNTVAYLPLHRIQGNKLRLLDYAIFPKNMSMERQPSFYLKLESSKDNGALEGENGGEEEASMLKSDLVTQKDTIVESFDCHTNHLFG